MSIEITVADLWTTAADDQDRRIPISEVADWEWHHVHARLSISINGKALPYLGFFGPDDVCLDTWVPVLTQLVATLSASAESQYTWDEGEQGQPAFRWERDGDEARVSVVYSPLSDAEGDPDWQDVPFRFGDLLEQVSRFLEELRCEMERQAPKMAAAWWKRVQSTVP